MHMPAGTCGHCGYLVEGLASLTCPECGADLRQVGIRPRNSSTARDKRGDPFFIATVVWAVLVIWLATTSPWIHRNWWPLIRTAQRQTTLSTESRQYTVAYVVRDTARVFGSDSVDLSSPRGERRVDVQLNLALGGSIEFRLRPDGGDVQFDQIKPVASYLSGHFVEQTLVTLMRNLGLNHLDQQLQSEARVAFRLLRQEASPNAVDAWSDTMAWTRSVGLPYCFSAYSPTVLPVVTFSDVVPFVPMVTMGWLVLWGAVAIPLIRAGRRRRRSIPAAAPSAAPSTAATLCTRTVMFADMKDFTVRTLRRTRAGVADLIRKHRQISDEVVRKHGGRIIKTMGDGLLIAFESATDAALAGIEILDEVATHNREATQPDERFELRIAIATGEVLLERDDILGAPVNLASRIQQLAEPGELLASETTRSLANANEVTCADAGSHELKGFDGNVRVFKVQRAAGGG